MDVKEIHTFPNGIYPKVSVIAWLKFEALIAMLQSSMLATTQ